MDSTAQNYKKGKFATGAEKLRLLVTSSTRSIWEQQVARVDGLIEPFLLSPTPSLAGQFLNQNGSPMKICATCVGKPGRRPGLRSGKAKGDPIGQANYQADSWRSAT